jgi:hypothetical protein
MDTSLLSRIMKHTAITLSDQYPLSFPVRSHIVQTAAAKWSALTRAGTASKNNKRYWSDKITPEYNRPYIQPQKKSSCLILIMNTE